MILVKDFFKITTSEIQSSHLLKGDSRERILKKLNKMKKLKREKLFKIKFGVLTPEFQSSHLLKSPLGKIEF